MTAAFRTTARFDILNALGESWRLTPPSDERFVSASLQSMAVQHSTSTRADVEQLVRQAVARVGRRAGASAAAHPLVVNVSARHCHDAGGARAIVRQRPSAARTGRSIRTVISPPRKPGHHHRAEAADDFQPANFGRAGATRRSSSLIRTASRSASICHIVSGKVQARSERC